MSFTLRVPVRTLGKEPITELQSAEAIRVGEFHVRLEAKPPLLIATASGFETENAALEFLPRMIAGFWSLVVRWNIAFRADFDPATVKYYPDPIVAGSNIAGSVSLTTPVDAIIDVGNTVVFETGKRIRWLGMGEATAVVQTPSRLALPTFKDTILREDAAKALSDERLRTVLDLFNAYFYETSLRAKFITLVMILEVLAPAGDKHPVAQELIKELKTRVREKFSTEADPDARHALESLDRELTFRRETSIRRRVRRLITEEFASEPRGERERLESIAVAAYDARGTLVHTGTLAQDALSRAHEETLPLVRRVLARRLGIREV